jgi:hypothetical protein
MSWQKGPLPETWGKGSVEPTREALSKYILFGGTDYLCEFRGTHVALYQELQCKTLSADEVEQYYVIPPFAKGDSNMQKMMSMQAMESAPEGQAGSYLNDWIFKALVAMIDARFPGAGAYILKAAELLPWSKLGNAIQNAWADWQEGKDWITIFKEAVSEWLVIEPSEPDAPIRMSAKATA